MQGTQETYMAFKENLLKKIEVEALASKIMGSIGAPDSGSKIDRQAVRQILEMTQFRPRKERDLELFVRLTSAGKSQVLVLDNELALYQTTVDDVVLRKSPTLKEMISIRNAIKILNDKDVVLSKRRETVTTIMAELIESLDLSFSSEDIEAILADGWASMENGYGEGVAECLMLMSEILGYTKAPKSLSINHQLIFGAFNQIGDGKKIYGPLIAYDRMHNRLRWIGRQVDLSDKKQINELRREITSEASSEKMGEAALLQLGILVQNSEITDIK